jgi:2'-5' RNA ligase
VPRSAIIVAVPEAEPLVHEWRMRYDSAAIGIPAHITLIFPFVPADEIGEELVGELRELFAAQSAFSFTLARVARFPEVAWLAPEPDEPFRRLTNLIFSRYPDYLPYEGIHDDVIPHLTVGRGDAAFQDEVDNALISHLPVEARVNAVTLIVEDDSGQWRPAERFPLG